MADRFFKLYVLFNREYSAMACIPTAVFVVQNFHSCLKQLNRNMENVFFFLNIEWFYFRNLPYKITTEEMYDIFGKYGGIRQIRV